MTENRKIYTIFGMTGEHEDHATWVVCSYLTQKEAENHIQILTKWLQENELEYTTIHTSTIATRRKMAFEKIKCPYDPGFQIDYTGTEYFCEETDLYLM